MAVIDIIKDDKDLKMSTAHTYYMFAYMCALAGEAKILLIKCQPHLLSICFWERHPSSLSVDINICQTGVRDDYFLGWDNFNDSICVERIIVLASS